MVEILQAHRRTLSTSLAELDAISTDGAGVRIALGIYKHILQDGISILESIINHLTRPQAHESTHRRDFQ